MSAFPRIFRRGAPLLVLASACAAPRPPPLLADVPTASEVRALPGDAARGGRHLTDRAFGRTGLSCGSCHTLRPEDEAVRPAPPLAGAAARAALWSGHAPDLSTAVGMCAERYLAVPPPDGEALGDLVAAIRALPAAAAPARTFAHAIPDPLEGGRAEAGAMVYRRACAGCHETGAAPPAKDAGWPPRVVAAAVRGLDRPRHPGSLMPPFPIEALSDADVRDLAAWVDAGAR